MLALAIKRARQATNTKPTEAQKIAGNYAKGTVRLHGLTVKIENPKGSYRCGKDPNGKEWKSRLACDYGYIRSFRAPTIGADGDHVDVFIGPHPESELVFVVDQVKANGRFDEHKALAGFLSEKEAVAAYRANYPAGWRVGPVTTMTMPEFKHWLEHHDTTKPAARKKKPVHLVFYKASVAKEEARA